MNTIRVELADDFRGEDVVLLAMDGAGVATFTVALKDAEVQGFSRLQHDGTTHEFLIQAGAAEIDLGNDHVVWRLDQAKALEIIDDLNVMASNDHPGHNYVDIAKPTDTLVLSRDEYVGVINPT
jgi:hypothetical protein